MAKPIHMTASNVRSMLWPRFASTAAFESLVMGLNRGGNSIAAIIAPRITASRDCVTVTISGGFAREPFHWPGSSPRRPFRFKRGNSSHGAIKLMLRSQPFGSINLSRQRRICAGGRHLNAISGKQNSHSLAGMARAIRPAPSWRWLGVEPFI